MKRFLPLITFLVIGGPSVAAEPFVGEIRTYAYDFCPEGEEGLNGRKLPLSQNTALFSLLGTNYGGNGESDFALPTVKPIYTATRAPLIQCIAEQGVFPPRP